MPAESTTEENVPIYEMLMALREARLNLENVVEAAERALRRMTARLQTIPCPTCNGDGEVDEADCPFCKGSGDCA